MEHVADRLTAAVAAKGAPVCVGIDPVYERLPGAIQEADSHPAIAIQSWGGAVLEAIAPHTPAVKFQSACFERYHDAGIAVLDVLMMHARQLGLFVILDAKRGDISTTSEHYAAATLDIADMVTVNPYMGPDAMEPFVSAAAASGKGVLVLVRTSNPGSDAIQSQKLTDGRTVAEAVADMTAKLGEPHVGKSGYSLVGAVVGATKRQDIASLRRRMPQQIFLLPGYGAQGGTAADVKAAMDSNGRGVLVAASRSVIYPQTTGDWQQAVAAAAAQLHDDIAAIR